MRTVYTLYARCQTHNLYAFTFLAMQSKMQKCKSENLHEVFMKNKMNKSQLPNKIRYEYQEESNLAMQYAHGVWGGINPQGEIEINFYTEQDKIPTNSERYLKPDGSFGPEITLTEEDTRIVTRKINAKVLINRHTARALLGWLAEKLENLEAEDLRNFEMEFNKNGRKQ